MLRRVTAVVAQPSMFETRHLGCWQPGVLETRCIWWVKQPSVVRRVFFCTKDRSPRRARRKTLEASRWDAAIHRAAFCSQPSRRVGLPWQPWRERVRPVRAPSSSPTFHHILQSRLKHRDVLCIYDPLRQHVVYTRQTKR